MKFIFPQNYRFKNKLFGIFDYSSLILNFIWDLFIFILINLFFKNLNIKLFIFILFCFPVFLFSIIGFNHESIIYIFFYLINYIKSNKLYLFSKK